MGYVLYHPTAAMSISQSVSQTFSPAAIQFFPATLLRTGSFASWAMEKGQAAHGTTPGWALEKSNYAPGWWAGRSKKRQREGKNKWIWLETDREAEQAIFP